MTGFSQVPKYIALMILDRRELEASWGNIALSCKWARRHINLLRIKKLSERGIDIYPASHYYLGDKKLKSTLPEPLLPRLFQDL